jgi:hypothetical protein
VNTASLRRTLTACLVAAAGLSGGCGAVDNRPAEWGYISPALFQPNCATTSCHSPAAAVSGLDFSTPDNGYASLTRLWVWVVTAPDAGAGLGLLCATVNGTYVCEEHNRPLVTPFDPEGSRLVNVLRARDAPRMPPDRPLPEDDIRLVERWILNGACQYGLSCASDAGPLDATSRPGDATTDGVTGH